MSKYRKKPVIIEAITFDEFIEYGKEHGGNIVNGMPWHFEYEGYPVTHETDERYLIPTLEGVHNFTPKDMLITGIKGEIYPCKLDIFEKTYDKIGFEEPTKSERRFTISDFIEKANYSIEKCGGFYKEITLPYHELLDLKNYFMNTYEPMGYFFTLYNKSERGDEEITMGFRLEKIIKDTEEKE